VLSILIVALATQPVFLMAGSFLQLEEDIGLTPTTLGILTATFFLTAAITSAPLGRVVERIGWRTSMRINVVGSVAVLIAIALLARSFAAFLFVGGAFYGFANPAANTSLAEQVDPSRRGIIFGLKHAGIPTSTLLAGLAIPMLILTIGWPATYAIAVLLAPVVWLLIPTEHAEAIPLAVAAMPGRGSRPLNAIDLGLLAGAAALSALVAISLGTFLVAAAVEEASFSESAAGILLFAGSLASITGRVTAGAVTDRVGGRGFGGLVVMMGTGSVVFFLLPQATSAVAFVTLVLVAFATGWGWTGLMTFTVVNANTSTVAASSAITQAGIFLGAGLGPVLLGWVIDTTSFQTSWALVSLALLIAAAIVTTVGVRTRRPEPAQIGGRGR
jgi:MFS family permease